MAALMVPVLAQHERTVNLVLVSREILPFPGKVFRRESEGQQRGIWTITKVFQGEEEKEIFSLIERIGFTAAAARYKTEVPACSRPAPDLTAVKTG